MNHFLPMIRDGRIAEEADLKRVFWNLAAKLHPDTAADGVDSDAFIRLRRDYEEAMDEMRSESDSADSAGPVAGDLRPRVPRFDPVAFLDVLEELVAGGLPVDPSIRKTNTLYMRRLERMNGICGAPGTPFTRPFSEMERDYYLIRGGNIIDNPLFGKVKLFFYNACSFRHTRFRIIGEAVRRWHGEILDPLKERSCFGLIEYMEWIIDNLIE